MNILASKTPNQGLDDSFCCWTAGQGLAQKDVYFTDTGVTAFPVARLQNVAEDVGAGDDYVDPVHGVPEVFPSGGANPGNRGILLLFVVFMFL